MGDRVSIFIPVADEWFCVGERGVIHAATVGQALRRQQKPPSRRRKTYDTLCGRRGRAHGVKAVTETGEHLGYSLVPWAPPARFDGDERCRDCWVETGKPRPNPSFRELRKAG